MKKQILSEEFKRMRKLAGILNESREKIWAGGLIPIPSDLHDELMKYSNSEEEINDKLGYKRLKGRYSDKFYEIDFEGKKIFYAATAGPNEYNDEDFYEVESFSFGKGDTAYKGEIDSILKNLIEKIKEKGIQPNNN